MPDQAPTIGRFRVLRTLGPTFARAEEALQRAIALNPGLSSPSRCRPRSTSIAGAPRTRWCDCSARRNSTAATPRSLPRSCTHADAAGCWRRRSAHTRVPSASIPRSRRRQRRVFLLSGDGRRSMARVGDDPEFRAVVMTAKVRCEHAAAQFASLGGPTLLAWAPPAYTASLMRATSDTRKRLGRKRAGRVGECMLER
jgi:hypothetical protein